MTSTATLLVNGRRYEGWKSVAVSRSMRAISGSFTLSVSERYPGSPGAWPIYPGDECELRLDGETVITGYIDDRSASFGAASHDVTVTGRDRSADLVDSAPDIGVYEMTGLNALQIASSIAQKFGIRVTSGASGLKKLDRFDIQPGETAFETINRACELSGVFATGQTDGTVRLSREGQDYASTKLIEGENVLAASYDASHRNRFHEYIVGGQHFGNDNLFGESAAAVEGRVVDNNIRKTRTAYIRAASNMTIEQATERAIWEAKNRAATGSTASITVQGWRQGNGQLWGVNTQVGIRLPTLGLVGDWVIADVSFTQNESGTITTLGLVPPGSFTPAPSVPDAGGYAEWT